MTVYLIMKNYEAIDYEDVPSNTPIGYLLEESKANEEVERLNKENEKLLVKQKKAYKLMEKWELKNPNPLAFNADGTQKSGKQLKDPINIELYKEHQAKYRKKAEKYGNLLYEDFEKLNYSVRKLDKFENN